MKNDNYRIVLVTAGDLSHARGDTVHVSQLSKELGKLRPVTVLHRGLIGVCSGQVMTGGELTSPSNAFRIFVFHLFLLFWFAFAAPRRTVVYGHDWSVTLIAFLVCLIRRFRVVYEVNGLVTLQMPHVTDGKRISLFVSLQAFVIRNSHWIVTVTDHLATSICNRTGVEPQRVSVIPNAGDADFEPVAKNVARERLGLSLDSKIVGFVGNLTAWEGVSQLLESFQEVALLDSNYLLIIIGDGRERTSLQEKARRLGIESCVSFVGYVSHDLALMHMCAFDVGVVPLSDRRLYDETGSSAIKAYEYMTCGIPIVAGAFPGLGDEIANAGCGVVVQPGDNKAFANAIYGVVENKGIADRLGSAGRKYIHTGRSWKEAARQVEKVCRETRRVRNGRRGNQAWC